MITKLPVSKGSLLASWIAPGKLAYWSSLQLELMKYLSRACKCFREPRMDEAGSIIFIGLRESYIYSFQEKRYIYILSVD